MAALKVRPQAFKRFLGDALIGLFSVKFRDWNEIDSAEVPFCLRFRERVGVDELAVDALAIGSKRRRGELHDRLRLKLLLKGFPRARRDVVGLVDEEV